ncbi:MAG: hypothetical protein ACI92Z_001143 [Paracoccaceae bacterium]|jgi:hypothetical protein
MTWTDKLNTTLAGLRNLNTAIPDTSKAFGALNAAVNKAVFWTIKPKNSSLWAFQSQIVVSPVLACISTP